MLRLGRQLCRDQRLRELPQAIQEQRLRPLRDAHPDALAAPNDVAHRGLDEIAGPAFTAAPGGQPELAVRGEVHAGGLPHRVQLPDHGGDGIELAGEQVHDRTRVEGERKLAERAGRASHLLVAG